MPKDGKSQLADGTVIERMVLDDTQPGGPINRIIRYTAPSPSPTAKPTTEWPGRILKREVSDDGCARQSVCSDERRGACDTGESWQGVPVMMLGVNLIQMFKEG